MQPKAKSPEPIHSILIVGGGTAGWMAAVYLNRFLRYTDCHLMLVESADIGTIGVGEATIPRLVSFVRNMRFDESAFMRDCHATYKLGIKFIDWHVADDEYWHPFGVCGGTIDGIDLFHFWVRGLQTGGRDGALSNYSLQALLADANKAPRPLRGSSPIMERGAYAYHLDAAALAAFLKRIATNEGVEHHFDDVREVVLDSTGAIDHIDTESGRTLKADLYIDCTGFRAALAEQALKDPWIDWSHLLLCDRAVATPLPSDPAMRPYTRATAMGAGWKWQIPLSHRMGCGYVYSSAHIDDDTATQELLGTEPPEKVVGAAPRYLRMRVGRRKTFWNHNCIAIGLASGFIEPLESTGIYFVQIALELLMDYFPSRLLDESLRRNYNDTMTRVYEEVRDFIILHYVLSRRDDTRFWRDSRAVLLPDTLLAAMELYDAIGMIRPGLSPFPPTSYHFVYAGNNRLPFRPSPHVNRVNPEEIGRILERIKIDNVNVADPLPTHRALMQSIHENIR